MTDTEFLTQKLTDIKTTFRNMLVSEWKNLESTRNLLNEITRVSNGRGGEKYQSELSELIQGVTEHMAALDKIIYKVS